MASQGCITVISAESALKGFLGGASGVKTTNTEPLRLDNGENWFRPFNASYSYNTKSAMIGGATLGYNW